MSESLDESMTGMGDQPDYDDWADETPDPPDRLTELATHLAELAGLTIGAPLAAEPRQPTAFVQLTCLHCGHMHAVVLGAEGMTTQTTTQHVCGSAPMAPTGQPYLAFALAVRSGA